MLGRLARYVVLPSEITAFENTYLRSINRIALVFFALHVPFFTVLAALNHTGPFLAAVLTALVAGGPLLAKRALSNPRHVSLVFGVTAMLMGGLMVHFGRGLWTIEMHFYFFVALALLAVFANPMVIVVAALTVALHHLILWALLPASVFNYEAPVTSVLVHAAFVVVESVAACFVARSFFDNVIGLERIVGDRTRALDAKNGEMQLVFDNVKQGFIAADRRGRLSAEHSRALATWLGVPREGEMAWEFFGRTSSDFAAWLALGWQAIVDNELPLEVVLAQLPTQLVADSRTLEVTYQAIGAGDDAENFLIIVTDASERLAHERAERVQRETMAAFARITGDRRGFLEFLDETESRVKAIVAEPCRLDAVTLKREIHTVKGNTALFGLSSVAALCQAIEERAAEDDERVSDTDRARLAAAWSEVTGRLEVFLDRQRRQVIELDASEYRALRESLLGARSPLEVARVVDALEHEAVHKRLARLGEQAQALASRLGRGPLTLEIDDGGVRLPPEPLSGFWSTLVHVVRNAVDHGLSGQEATPPLLRFSARLDDHELKVIVADNGRGIDWEAVREAATRRGLPSETKDDLERALFADGLTTRDVATDVSGRGVGLAAVLEECRALGGRIAIASRPGHGTSFTFHLPRAGLCLDGKRAAA